VKEELTGAVWRKSVKSGNNGGCVEVADLGARVAVRDSKNPHGSVLLFEADAWDGFLADIRSGNLTR
jgi:hypothetical protein